MIQSLGYAVVEGDRKYAADDYGQISYFSTSAERWSLELHWNVINSPAQRGQCSLSWNDMEFLPPQSDGPRLLTPNSLLILAAVHACVGHRFDSLQQLCDIRQICRGAAGPIDAARLPAACVRLRCVTAMSWSLDLVARMFACAEARKLLSDETFAAAARGGAWSTIKPQTVLRPQTLGSRLRRSLARKRLKTAA